MTGTARAGMAFLILCIAIGAVLRPLLREDVSFVTTRRLSGLDRRDMYRRAREDRTVYTLYQTDRVPSR